MARHIRRWIYVALLLAVVMLVVAIIGRELQSAVGIVAERQRLLVELQRREARVVEGSLSGVRLPWSWRVAGARPVLLLDLKLYQTTDSDYREIERLFPEAGIGLGGGFRAPVSKLDRD